LAPNDRLTPPGPPRADWPPKSSEEGSWANSTGTRRLLCGSSGRADEETRLRGETQKNSRGVEKRIDSAISDASVQGDRQLTDLFPTTKPRNGGGPVKLLGNAARSRSKPAAGSGVVNRRGRFPVGSNQPHWGRTLLPGRATRTGTFVDSRPFFRRLGSTPEEGTPRWWVRPKPADVGRAERLRASFPADP